MNTAKRKRIFINEPGADHFNLPDLLEIQLESYYKFMQADCNSKDRKKTGLQELFLSSFPIKAENDNVILEFLDYELGTPPEKNCPSLNTPSRECMMEKCPVCSREYSFYKFKKKSYRLNSSPEDCRKNNSTYCIPLYIKLRLTNKISGESKERKFLFLNIPLMTKSGTFIIKGMEKVVVSRLSRAPGAYYSLNKNLYHGEIMPDRGPKLEFFLDITNEHFYVAINHKRKIPATVLLRALGFSDEQMQQEIDRGDTLKYIKNTLRIDKKNSKEHSLKEIFRLLHPEKPFIYEEAKTILYELYSNPKRYDLGCSGRYKLNHKLSFTEKLAGQRIAENIFHPEDLQKLKPIVNSGDTLTTEILREIETFKIPRLNILASDDMLLEVVRPKISRLVDMESGEGLCQSLHEGHCVCGDIMDEETGKKIIADGEPLTNDIIYLLNERKNFLLQLDADSWRENVPTGMICLYKGNVLDKEDILHAMKYIVDLSIGVGSVDDINHLGNRHVQRAGELLTEEMRSAFCQMENEARDKMSADADNNNIKSLIDEKPIKYSIENFFNSHQLSQLLDNTNPLSALSHKRKLATLVKTISLKARDVHPSHLGRICPIETPEGKNVGLTGSLALNARINDHGFITTPLRNIFNGHAKENDPVKFYDALQEEKHRVVTYNHELYAGKIEPETILPIKLYTNGEQDFILQPAKEAELIHVSPMQMISASTSLIPFIEHNDANRATMGSHMICQSVPLVQSEEPIVGTGMESYLAVNSELCLTSGFEGIVEYADAVKIVVRRTGQEDGNDKIDTYHLRKYSRSNQGTCLNQKPCVKAGDTVAKGQVLADGPSMFNGEISPGKNIMCAFMPFYGHNFEDAIVLSERLVYDDIYTSVHIDQYEIEARKTRFGAEEITRDIPNISDDMKKNLDDDGIILVGTEVEPGDILVGKITPKDDGSTCEKKLTPEEKRILTALYGDSAETRKNVRNTSLTVPRGKKGRVIDVVVFSRNLGDELPSGVEKLVRVFLAQRRKISEGDKMAGRHGNKGVISKIFPISDMPFLADGQPVDIILNPLGVPSRMNIGQLLETHLGWVGKKSGEKYATGAFNSNKTNERFVINCLKRSGLPEDGMETLYDGKTGEPFNARIMVGYIYMMKLIHMVDDKIHARSTGSHCLITEQPLGGRTVSGGQRFGEMEVWALEAYGAAHVLRELLTLKSDHVEGRTKLYEMIVKGGKDSYEELVKNAEKNHPEAFCVLVSELKSIGLNIELNPGEGKSGRQK
jgi:DNA-directed RNA polymerase subunit beta